MDLDLLLKICLLIVIAGIGFKLLKVFILPISKIQSYQLTST